MARIRVAMYVEEPDDIGRPRWEPHSFGGGRHELHITFEDAHLVFSEEAAMRLSQMLDVMVNQLGQ